MKTKHCRPKKNVAKVKRETLVTKQRLDCGISKIGKSKKKNQFYNRFFNSFSK